MKRLSWPLAALAIALVAVPTATAAGYELPAKKNALTISVVSSPAAYVSGGDARIEIAVPEKTALGDVDVTLNGADVTSAFGPDPEGNHQLEGVVTGLPLGTEHDRRPQPPEGEGEQALRRAEADEQPDPGADLLRPAAGAVRVRDGGQRRRVRPAADPAVPDLRDADRRLVPLRERGQPVSAVRPGRAAARRVDPADDDDRRQDGADDPPLGARRDQPLHVLDPDPLARVAADGDARPLRLEREGAPQLLRRSRDRPHPGRRERRRPALPARAAHGLRRPLLERQPHEHPLQPPARRRDGDHGQGPLRLGLRGAGVHGRGRRLRRRDPAVRLRPEPSRPDRRRRAAVLVPRHGHADDPRRRLRADRALVRLEGAREPALDLADVGEPHRSPRG